MSVSIAIPLKSFDSTPTDTYVKVWHRDIRREDRLVFALDVPTKKDAIALVETLGDAVGFYKIGWELFMSGDYFSLIRELARRKKKVFADPKVIDIPETMARAVRNLKLRSDIYLTCLALYPSGLGAAVQEAK